MITVFIPTMNRSPCMRRLLGYFAETKFQGCVLIGDSSDANHLDQMHQVIADFEDKLNINYIELPAAGGVECAVKLIDAITTPYAVYLSDDDFLVPAGMNQCIEFLERNPDYSCAHGLGVLAVYGNSQGAGFKMESTGLYRLPLVLEESAAQRLSRYLGDYTVNMFSVCRTRYWQRMYREVPQVADHMLGGEILPCALSVTLGKVKELDCFYLVRQGDPRQKYSDTFDWVMGPNWHASCQTLLDALASEIVQQDGVDLQAAKYTAKMGFWAYLNNGFMHHWKYRHGMESDVEPGFGQKIRNSFCRIPGASYVWKRIKRFRRGDRDLSLAGLLNPSSPYHADFLPIYRHMNDIVPDYILPENAHP
jgi:glycosyltransferase domain-containing protein